MDNFRIVSRQKTQKGLNYSKGLGALYFNLDISQVSVKSFSAMIEQLFEGICELVARLWSVWTLPIFTWMTQQLFVWMKGINVPRLTSKPYPRDPERMELSYISAQRNCLVFTQAHYYSWKAFTVNNSVYNKKHFSPWFINPHMQKTHDIALYIAQDNRIDSTCMASSKYCPKEMIAEWNCKRSTPESHPQVNTAGFCKQLEEFKQQFLCDPVQNYLQAPQDKMELFKLYQDSKEDCRPFLEKTVTGDSESMGSLCFPDKICSSAASLDSGYRSHHSFESGYKAMEECGVALFISDCCYNKEGKLIRMYVGFEVYDESSSESCFETEDDEASDDDDDDEDFIVFDTQSWCPESNNTCDVYDIAITSFAIQVSEPFSMWDNVNEKASCPQTSQNSNNCMNTDQIKVPITKISEDSQDVEQESQCDESFGNSSCDVQDRINKVSGSAGTSKKRVQFKVLEDCDVHNMVVWDHAYRAARKSPWKQCVIDRERFKHRIQQAEAVLTSVLLDKLGRAQNQSY